MFVTEFEFQYKMFMTKMKDILLLGKKTACSWIVVFQGYHAFYIIAPTVNEINYSSLE